MEGWLLVGAIALWSLYKSLKQGKHEAKVKARWEEKRKYVAAAEEANPDAPKLWSPNNRKGPFPKDVRAVVLQKTDGHCFYCAKDIKGGYWEIDHVWPKRLGGVDDLINLVPSCESCNAGKDWSPPLTYFVWKWLCQVRFTAYEIEFLEAHADMSLEYLTEWPVWKGYCNSYLPHTRAFYNLVKGTPSFYGLSARELKKMEQKGRELLREFDSPRSQDRSFNSIEKVKSRFSL
jgi:hypothetical protein